MDELKNRKSWMAPYLVQRERCILPFVTKEAIFQAFRNGRPLHEKWSVLHAAMEFYGFGPAEIIKDCFDEQYPGRENRVWSTLPKDWKIFRWNAGSGEEYLVDADLIPRVYCWKPPKNVVNADELTVYTTEQSWEKLQQLFEESARLAKCERDKKLARESRRTEWDVKEARFAVLVDWDAGVVGFWPTFDLAKTAAKMLSDYRRARVREISSADQAVFKLSAEFESGANAPDPK